MVWPLVSDFSEKGALLRPRNPWASSSKHGLLEDKAGIIGNFVQPGEPQGLVLKERDLFVYLFMNNVLFLFNVLWNPQKVSHSETNEADPGGFKNRRRRASTTCWLPPLFASVRWSASLSYHHRFQNVVPIITWQLLNTTASAKHSCSVNKPFSWVSRLTSVG